ncbi:MAG: hypothetical protein JSV52_03425 [Candidatus Zixiibacteriota bacterium]|nr:MAG: hypothetical protein JSV52_03425 [candidate division Zixibacteria bacterium]
MNEKKATADAAVLEHLSRCPACARMVRANRRLDDLFDASTGIEQVPSFSAVRERVRTLAANRTIQEKIVAYIKNQLRTRPGLLAGASLAVAAFLFITLVPLSYTHTTGYTISVTESEDENDSTLQNVERAIVEADVDNTTVVVVSDGDVKRFIVTPVTSRVVADRIVVSLKEAVKDSVEVAVEPIVKIKSGTIYAQVVSRVKTDEKKHPKVKIQLKELLFDGDLLLDVIENFDMDDGEVERQLSKWIIDQGLAEDDFEVSSETDTSANVRTIKLVLPSDQSSEEEAEIEVQVSRGEPNGSHKNMMISLKSGTIMNVQMDEMEIAASTIIMKVSTKDSIK